MDFIGGFMTVLSNSDTANGTGVTIHQYRANKDMNRGLLERGRRTSGRSPARRLAIGTEPGRTDVQRAKSL